MIKRIIVSLFASAVLFLFTSCSNEISFEDFLIPYDEDMLFQDIESSIADGFFDNVIVNSDKEPEIADSTIDEANDAEPVKEITTNDSNSANVDTGEAKEAVDASVQLTDSPTSIDDITAPQQDNYGSDSVWIPGSGKKYHSTPSCSNMKSPSTVSLSEAISMGYEPCKRCH